MNSLQPMAPLPYLGDLGERIQRYPLEALGIGFLTGFVIGGGQQSRLGQGLIGFAARIAVRRMAVSALSDVLRKS
jgi:hypothetical protein